ncbi:hypothetical protein A2U01_0062931, partial [Trifolium medium]|nr:hypothetical protein [Trifolium medium]
LTQERDAAVATSGELAREKAALEEEVEGLKKSVAIQYDEGFQFSLDQVKVLFPDIDKERLGEANAMKSIKGDKLVDYVPPVEE